MKSMAVFSFLFLLTLPAFAGTVDGFIEDTSKTAIPNAFVVVHLDSWTHSAVSENAPTVDSKTTTTDSTGHFSLELPEGNYDIFISASGFEPHCEKIVVKKQGRSYKAQLRAATIDIMK